MATQNPNWPRFQVLWSPTGHLGYGNTTGDISFDGMAWVDITTRCLSGVQIQRGKQYELDAVTAGTATFTWDNRDGAFDPENTSSPYYPNVLSYQPVRIRCQLPAVTNLLTLDQATCGQGNSWPAGTNAAVFGIANNWGPPVTTLSSASAYTGSLVYQTTFNGGAPAYYQVVCTGMPLPVVAGQYYSFSAYGRTVSGQAAALLASFQWLAADGTTIGYVGGVAQTPTVGATTWTPLSASGQAPAGAVAVNVYVCLNAALTATTVVQIGALQFEQTQTPSTFTPPGTMPTNLLTIDQATCGLGRPWPQLDDPSIFGVYSNPAVATSASPLTPQYGYWQIYTPSVAPASGASCYDCEFDTAVQDAALLYLQVPVTPGQAYSWQLQARCVTSGQNPTVFPEILWCTAGGTVLTPHVDAAPTTLTGAPAASWYTLTISGTAPATAAYARLTLCSNAAITAATELQVASLQWEANPAPSAWSLPGVWANLFTGYVERYPRVWNKQGTFGTTLASAVDAFALLSQSKLKDPLTAAIMTPGSGGAPPSFAYMLGDASASTGTPQLFVDATGNRAAATIGNSKFGAGTITPATTQSAASATGGFLGSSQTVTAISSAAPVGTDAYGQAMSWIQLPTGPNGKYGPGSGSGVGFTRMIAFKVTATPSYHAQIWMAQDWTFTDRLQLFVDSSLNLYAGVYGSSSQYLIKLGTVDLNNWHLAFISLDPTGTIAGAGLDGAWTLYYPQNYNPARGFTSDMIGAEFSGNGNPLAADNNFVGNVAMAVEWPYQLTNTQVGQIYNSWRTAYSGVNSGERYLEILSWANWLTPVDFDLGITTSYGPATDVANTDALTSLQAVVDTEGGQHYADGSGTINLRSRARRWDPGDPVFVFGERADLGEYPYLDGPATDYDPTLTTTLAVITLESTSQTYSALNQGSSNQYGVRERDVTSLSTNPQECQDKAAYLTSRYAAPAVRYSSIVLNVGANPRLWPVATALEIGTRVRVMRRPPGYTNPIQFDGWVESLSWTFDDQNNAQVALQLSPVDTNPYTLMAALHTTLAQPAAVNATSLTLEALADAATNPAQCYFYLGQRLTIGSGTSSSQQVTVTALPNVTPGYTTFTLGVSALTASASAGAVLCEALPAATRHMRYGGPSGQQLLLDPVTDPTTWDTVLVPGQATPEGAFDNGVFAY